MAFAEVIGALHFLQSADGAGEFEAAIARGIEGGGLGIGGGEQFDAMLVERVDQRDEARRALL